MPSCRPISHDDRSYTKSDIDALLADKADADDVPKTLAIGSHDVFLVDRALFGDFEFETSGASHAITFFDAPCTEGVAPPGPPVVLTSAGGPNGVGITDWSCSDGNLAVFLLSENGSSVADIDFDFAVYDSSLRLGPSSRSTALKCRSRAVWSVGGCR